MLGIENSIYDCLRSCIEYNSSTYCIATLQLGIFSEHVNKEMIMKREQSTLMNVVPSGTMGLGILQSWMNFVGMLYVESVDLFEYSVIVKPRYLVE